MSRWAPFCLSLPNTDKRASRTFPCRSFKSPELYLSKDYHKTLGFSQVDNQMTSQERGEARPGFPSWDRVTRNQRGTCRLPNAQKPFSCLEALPTLLFSTRVAPLISSDLQHNALLEKTHPRSSALAYRSKGYRRYTALRTEWKLWTSRNVVVDGVQ